MPKSSREPSELRFDRQKDGQTISVQLHVEGDQVQIAIGPDERTGQPGQTMTCSLDQWHAIRYAAEWYFHALAESQNEHEWEEFHRRRSEAGE